jgi:hypothetical protein
MHDMTKKNIKNQDEINMTEKIIENIELMIYHYGNIVKYIKNKKNIITNYYKIYINNNKKLVDILIILENINRHIYKNILCIIRTICNINIVKKNIIKYNNYSTILSNNLIIKEQPMISNNNMIFFDPNRRIDDIDDINNINNINNINDFGDIDQMMKVMENMAIQFTKNNKLFL